MSQHTPGPWHVHEAQHCDGEFWASIGYADGRGPIADIVGAEGNHAKHYVPVAGLKFLVTPVEEQRANARLIAAAPDLLRMLRRCAALCEPHSAAQEAKELIAKINSTLPESGGVRSQNDPEVNNG